MATPAPRTAVRRSPAPASTGWKLPAESKGCNFHPFSHVRGSLANNLATSLDRARIDRSISRILLDAGLGNTHGHRGPRTLCNFQVSSVGSSTPALDPTMSIRSLRGTSQTVNYADITALRLCTESLAEIVLASNFKPGQSSPGSVNGCPCRDEFIAGRLTDRYAVARTNRAAQFAVEETCGNPARAYHG